MLDRPYSRILLVPQPPDRNQWSAAFQSAGNGHRPRPGSRLSTAAIFVVAALSFAPTREITPISSGIQDQVAGALYSRIRFLPFLDSWFPHCFFELRSIRNPGNQEKDSSMAALILFLVSRSVDSAPATQEGISFLKINERPAGSLLLLEKSRYRSMTREIGEREVPRRRS